MVYPTKIDEHNIKLIVCINYVVFYGTLKYKGQFVPTTGGGKTAHSAKYDQRDTMHNTLGNAVYSKKLKPYECNNWL